MFTGFKPAAYNAWAGARNGLKGTRNDDGCDGADLWGARCASVADAAADVRLGGARRWCGHALASGDVLEQGLDSPCLVWLHLLLQSAGRGMTGPDLKVVRYHAYIDEAGDEGLGKLKVQGVSGGQSTFFGIGAFLVDAVSDTQLPKWRDEAVAAFPQRTGRTLHFKELRNHEQKVAVCHSLATKPFGACVVLSFKPTIVDSSKFEVFKQPQYLYNYLVRFTLERITATVRKRALQQNHTAALTVTFSRREGTDYDVMRKYLQLLKDGKEVMPSIGHIDWAVFSPADIRVENHAVRAGLQLADVITSATFAAFEPGFYGHCEDRYCHTLRQRYIRNQGRALNCGLTFIPPIARNPMPEEQRNFAGSFA